MEREIKDFEREKCKGCKNRESIEMCEIIKSRIDGHLYCKNYEEKEDKDIIIYKKDTKDVIAIITKDKCVISKKYEIKKVNGERYNLIGNEITGKIKLNQKDIEEIIDKK